MSYSASTLGPYHVGKVLHILPHDATPPHQAEMQKTTTAEEDMILNDSRLEAILKYPAPSLAQTIITSPPGHDDSRQLEVVQPLAVGWKRGPQIVVCSTSLFTGRPPATYVAKIYDPLYYRQPPRSSGREPPASLTKKASVEYSREVAAYERIRRNNKSRPYRCTPEYFGSWSFQSTENEPIATGLRSTASRNLQARERTRTVCLILIEYIDGATMEDLATGPGDRVYEEMYQRYSEATRLSVWSHFIEAELWLRHIGVVHGDLEQRNILVSPKPTIDDKSSTLKPRAIIFDFNVADVVATSSSSFDSNAGLDAARLPPNPLPVWWSEFLLFNLHSWCPAWWVQDLVERRRWLQREYGGSKANRFQPYVELESVEVLSEEDKSYVEEMAGLPTFR